MEIVTEPSRWIHGHQSTVQTSSNSFDSRGDSLSAGGIVLFLMCLTVFGSGFMGLRPLVFGMRIHPYLIPLCLTTPFVIYHLAEFPNRISACLLIFVAIYCFPVVGGGVTLGEVAKVGFALLTIAVTAVLVRTRTDLVAGTLGLSLAVAAMGFLGSSGDEASLGNLDIGNKNVYSLYALPAILLSGFAILRLSVSQISKAILAAAAIACAVAIFLTGNRSGYLGVVVIALMLLWDRKLMGIFYVGLGTSIVAYIITQIYSAATFLGRMNQTLEGTAHDDARRDIQITCLQIALENPIFGVGANALPFEIGRRLQVEHRMDVMDSHNAFLHIAASSGLICLAALLASGLAMFFWRPDFSHQSAASQRFVLARKLLRMLVVLWAVRGVFSREVIYNPSFCISIGLAIGFCMVAIRSANHNAHAGFRVHPV